VGGGVAVEAGGAGEESLLSPGCAMVLPRNPAT